MSACAVRSKSALSGSHAILFSQINKKFMFRYNSVWSVTTAHSGHICLKVKRRINRSLSTGLFCSALFIYHINHKIIGINLQKMGGLYVYEPEYGLYTIHGTCLFRLFTRRSLALRILR